MRVDLHARVLARDGDELGHVQRAVVDPRSNEITHFVVRTGGLFALIPLLATATLGLSVAEIGAGSFKVRRDDVVMDVMLDELKADYSAQAEEKEITLSFARPPKLPNSTR